RPAHRRTRVQHCACDDRTASACLGGRRRGAMAAALCADLARTCRVRPRARLWPQVRARVSLHPPRANWQRLVPAVAKTSRDDVVAAARALLERDGVDGVSMQAIADEVGIRAPSLYKRFADRRAVLAELERVVFGEMQRALARVPISS